MNQRDEQRVIDALRDLTGGLIVTEQEMLTAGGRLRSSLEPRSPNRRAAMLIAAAAVILVAGLVTILVADRDENADPSPTPNPPTPAETHQSPQQAKANGLAAPDFIAGAQPTLPELTGIWMLRAPYGGPPLVVDGDGDWALTDYERNGVFASSTLAGDTWTRHLDSPFWERHGECPARHPWTAALAEDGSLRLTFAGGLNQCSLADDREVWDRLAPGPSPVADYLREASTEIGWRTPADWSFEGIYFSPETGQLLEVAPRAGTGPEEVRAGKTHRYWSYDTVSGIDVTPADEGELYLEAEAGTIEGSCSGGDFTATLEAGTVPEVEGLMASHQAMRITGSGETCSAGPGAGGVWIRVE